jgi:hypothetical protein
MIVADIGAEFGLRWVAKTSHRATSTFARASWIFAIIHRRDAKDFAQDAEGPK